MRSIKHISIIGSGNVATHLGSSLFDKGLVIDAVYSRKISRSRKLASKLKAKACSKFSQLKSDSDLYLIAVSDDAIAEVSAQLVKVIDTKAIVAHTSGSVCSTALETANTGVFYPLQSFSIDRKLDISTVPFCIHSKETRIEKLLLALARKLSKKVYKINDTKRAALHLAAVFSSNFSNHMYHLAADICEENKVDFDILKPLIIETAAKIKDATPNEMQTGPACRDDKQTMAKHLKKLTKNKSSKDIYKLVSKNIRSQYQ